MSSVPPVRIARRRKERIYPELVGPRSRARLLVSGVEVGGRWSDETKILVSQLSRAKARQETWLLRRRAEQAWRLRWGSLIACGVALSPSHSWSSPVQLAQTGTL